PRNTKWRASDERTALATNLTSALPRIHEIFRMEELKNPPVSFAIPPTDPWSSKTVPIEKWILGQYNRLLPAKASCRALANLLREHPDGVPVNRARKTIAKH